MTGFKNPKYFQLYTISLTRPSTFDKIICAKLDACIAFSLHFAYAQIIRNNFLHNLILISVTLCWASEVRHLCRCAQFLILSWM